MPEADILLQEVTIGTAQSSEVQVSNYKCPPSLALIVIASNEL